MKEFVCNVSPDKSSQFKTIQSAVDFAIKIDRRARIVLDDGVYREDDSPEFLHRNAVVHVHSLPTSFRPTRTRYALTAPLVIQAKNPGRAHIVQQPGQHGVYVSGGCLVAMDGIRFESSITRPSGGISIVSHSQSKVLVCRCTLQGGRSLATGMLSENHASIESYHCTVEGYRIHGLSAVEHSSILFTADYRGPCIGVCGMHNDREHYARAIAHKFSFIEINGARSQQDGILEANHGSHILVGTNYAGRHFDAKNLALRTRGGAFSFEYCRISKEAADNPSFGKYECLT